MFWCASQLATIDFKASDCATYGKLSLIDLSGRGLATSTCCGIEHYHIYWYCNDYKTGGRNIRDYLISEERASQYGKHKKHFEDMARELIAETTIVVNGTVIDKGISSSGHYTLGYDYRHQDYRMFLLDGSIACFRYDSKIGVCLTPFAYYYPKGCDLFLYPCDPETQKIRLDLRKFLAIYDTTVPSFAIDLPPYSENILKNKSYLLPDNQIQIRPGFDCTLPSDGSLGTTTTTRLPRTVERTTRRFLEITTLAPTRPMKVEKSKGSSTFYPSDKEGVISLSDGRTDKTDKKTDRDNLTNEKPHFIPPQSIKMRD